MPYIGKSPSAGVRQRYQYTATAGQTTFSGTDLGNLTLTYTDNNFVDVFQNGVLLKGGGTDYTATSGTSVVLATGASVSDVIEIIVYDVFSVGNFFNRTDSDSRYVNVDGDTMTGEFKANGGAVFNEDSADVDFRVESNGNANMLFVDGGNDSVVIGHNDANDGSVSSAFALQNIGTDYNSSSMGLARFSADVNAPTVVFHKSRNASIGGDTIVQDDDELGRIRFFGNDGTDFAEGARITVSVDDTPGAGDMPTRISFATSSDGSESPTERMRIGHGYYNNGAVFFGNYLGTGDYDDPGYNSSTGIALRALGGSSPAILTCSDSQHYIYKVGTGRMFDFNYKSSLGAGGSNVGFISTDGSNTTYSTSSDYRLKENISTDWDATTRLKQLKPSRFNWKANKDKTVDGFLAHEVSSIVPEAITGEKDAVDENGNPQYQGIDQSKLVPLLTKALQEAMARADALEARIKKLEDG